VFNRIRNMSSSSSSSISKYTRALGPLRAYLVQKKGRLLLQLFGAQIVDDEEYKKLNRLRRTIRWIALLDKMGSTLCNHPYRSHLSFKSPESRHEYYYESYELPVCFPAAFGVDLATVYATYGEGRWFKESNQVTTHLLKHWAALTPDYTKQFEGRDYMIGLTKTMQSDPKFKKGKELSAAAIYMRDAMNPDNLQDIADALPTQVDPRYARTALVMTAGETAKWRIKMLAVVAKVLTSDLRQQVADEVLETNGTHFLDTMRLRMFDLLAWLRVGEHVKETLATAVRACTASSNSPNIRTVQARCLLLYEVAIDFFSHHPLDGDFLFKCESDYESARSQYLASSPPDAWLLQSIAHRDVQFKRTGFLFHRKDHVLVYDTQQQEAHVDKGVHWLIAATMERQFFGVRCLSDVTYQRKLRLGLAERFQELSDRPGVYIPSAE
jgi:hypothetical protein